jgi:hypothetical protein
MLQLWRTPCKDNRSESSPVPNYFLLKVGHESDPSSRRMPGCETSCPDQAMLLAKRPRLRIITKLCGKTWISSTRTEGRGLCNRQLTS